MSRVLVLNTGSSSVKYRLFDGTDTVAKGLVERIGEAGGEAVDHDAALRKIMSETDLGGLGAVGHRVVTRGPEFPRATVNDDDVVAAIERVVPLAPLHNPAALTGIAVARDLLPDVPQVAVFDTAFHATIPPEGTTWAIDGGRSVATSMGMSPQGGLVMGTRSGDIDPTVVFHLHRVAGLPIREIERSLTRKGGLL